MCIDCGGVPKERTNICEPCLKQRKLDYTRHHDELEFMSFYALMAELPFGNQIPMTRRLMDPLEAVTSGQIKTTH